MAVSDQSSENINAKINWQWKIVLLTRLSPIFPFNLPTTATTQILQWIICIMGLMAIIAVTIYITRLAKKALDRSIQDGEIINVRC